MEMGGACALDKTADIRDIRFPLRPATILDSFWRSHVLHNPAYSAPWRGDSDTEKL